MYSTDLPNRLDLFLGLVPALAALTYSGDVLNRLDLFLTPALPLAQ